MQMGAGSEFSGIPDGSDYLPGPHNGPLFLGQGSIVLVGRDNSVFVLQNNNVAGCRRPLRENNGAAGHGLHRRVCGGHNVEGVVLAIRVIPLRDRTGNGGV